MHRFILKYATAIFLVLFAPSLAAAGGLEARSYPLPGHGSIQLQVPASWQGEIRQPPGELPPTIRFTMEDRSLFMLLLTPMFKVNDEMILPSPEGMREHLQRAVEAASQQAVEKNILIKELKGPSVTGYYFFATDRAPGPGEYKYMTQGLFRIGELAPMFTILSNDGAEAAVADALSMLENALHVK